jgi:hypothetical protein
MRDRRDGVDDKWQACAVLLNPSSFVRWGTGVTRYYKVGMFKVRRGNIRSISWKVWAPKAVTGDL